MRGVTDRDEQRAENYASGASSATPVSTAVRTTSYSLPKRRSNSAGERNGVDRWGVVVRPPDIEPFGTGVVVDGLPVGTYENDIEVAVLTVASRVREP